MRGSDTLSFDSVDENNLNYTFSFNCREDLENFDILPTYLQESIEVYIVKVIRDSFVKPADEDYITARLLAQKGMYRAFFWAAAQSMEKYLKAFLILRGESVKKFNNHKIDSLHSKACSISNELSTIKVIPHKEIKINPSHSKLIKTLSIKKFITDIESYGSADNRYNSSGVYFTWNYLFALDSYIFFLRQQIGIPPIEETLHKMDDALIEAFSLYNPWFIPSRSEHKEIPNSEFNLKMSQSSTTLDFLTGSNPPTGSKAVLEWLDKKMHLPKKISTRLKN